MKILFFAGSLRAGSLNKKLVKEAMRAASATDGIDAVYADLKEYPMPPYDGDMESASGIPDTVRKLGAEIMAADALVVATPEYNGSISGVLKNAIDWLSREKPVSLSGKPLLLLAASTGALGGVRGLWHSRVPFEALGVHVYPGMMGLSNASNAFDEEGRLAEEKPAKQLQKLMGDYLAHLQKK